MRITIATLIAVSACHADAGRSTTRDAVSTEGHEKFIIELAIDDELLTADDERTSRELKIESAQRHLFERLRENGAQHVAVLPDAAALSFVGGPELAQRLANELDATVTRVHRLYPTLDGTVSQVRADAPELPTSASGSAFAVAVVDTGVDNSHEFLRNRVVAGRCFYQPDADINTENLCSFPAIGIDSGAPCSHERCDHGTHVAGIAAGRSDGHRGVAPAAPIVSIQVFRKTFGDACLSGSSCISTDSGIVSSALSHVHELAPDIPIAAVNLSLGGRSRNEVHRYIVSQVARLRRDGIVVVASAGNAYDDEDPERLSYPAGLTGVLSVGAVSNSDEPAGFSNGGGRLDLWAPGVDVCSSVPGGGYGDKSGTSMAAPHVAGAIAALRSARPECSGDNIVTALRTSGPTIIDDRSPLGTFAARRLDVVAALDALGSCTPTPPGFVSGFPTGEHSIRVRWSDDSSNEDRFEIRLSDTNGLLLRSVNAPNNRLDDPRSTLDIATLDAGRTYRVAVRSCRGNVCSAETSGGTVTTDIHPRPRQPSITNVSTNLGVVDVSWRRAATGPAPTSFSVALVGRQTLRAVVAPSTGSFRWVNLDPDELYNVGVSACDTTGCSLPARATLRTPAVGHAPSNLRVIDRRSDRVDLSWRTPVSNVTYHELEVLMMTAIGEVRSVEVLVGPATTATRRLSSAAIQRAYRVRACTASGCTAFSRTAL